MLDRNILAQIAIQFAIVSMISNCQRFISRNQGQILKRLKDIFMLGTYVLIIDKNESNLDLIIKASWMNFDLKITLFEAIPRLFWLQKINASKLNWIKNFQGSATDKCILASLCACNCQIVRVMFKFDSLLVI